MIFRIKVGQLDENGKVIPDLVFWEDYDEPQVYDDPWGWSERLIQRFNQTLRPGQPPRKLLDVDIIYFFPEGQFNIVNNHDWKKVNMVTMIEGSRYFDKYKCIRCGITGRRYGFSSVIIRDSKYKKDKYDRCYLK